MRQFKVLLLSILASLFFGQSSLAYPVPCFLQHYYANQGGAASSACTTDLLADWSDTFLSDDTGIQDESATGTHDAVEGQALYFDGGTYVNLDTAITLAGDFKEISGYIKFDALSGTYVILSSDTNNFFGVNSDDHPYMYIAGSNSVFTEITLALDTLYQYHISRVGNLVTLTMGGVTSAKTISSSDFPINYYGGVAGTFNIIGNIWDTEIKDSTGTTVFSQPLAQGGSSPSLASEVGPDCTITGATLPGDWSNAPWFYSYNGSDGYVIADGTGTYAAGAYLPASYTSEGTLYTGKARQDLDVGGYGATLDGSEELTLAHLAGTESVTTLIGTSTPSVAAGKLTFTAGTINYVLLDDGTELIFESKKDSYQITVYDVRATGTQHHGTFTGATVGVLGQWNAAVADNSWLAQHGGSLVENLFANSEDFSGAGWSTSTGASVTGTNVINLTADLGSRLQQPIGSVITGQVVTLKIVAYGTEGETVSVRVDNTTTEQITLHATPTEYTISGTMASDVGTLYIRVLVTATGDTARTINLVSAGVAIDNPDFGYVTTTTAAIPLSIIPGKENPSTLDAAGNTKGFADWRMAPADTVIVHVPETPEMYGADTSRIMMQADGTLNDVDAADIIPSFGAEFRKTSVGMIATDGAQTGTCRQETSNYLYPDGYLEMLDNLEMLDTLEMAP